MNLDDFELQPRRKNLEGDSNSSEDGDERRLREC